MAEGFASAGASAGAGGCGCDEPTAAADRFLGRRWAAGAGLLAPRSSPSAPTSSRSARGGAVRALQLREGSRQELEVRRGWLTYSLLLCLQWPGSNRGLSLTALTLDGCVSTQTCTLAVGTQKILSSIKSRKGNLGSSRCDDEKPRQTIAPDHFFVVARLVLASTPDSTGTIAINLIAIIIIRITITIIIIFLDPSRSILYYPPSQC